MLSGKQGKFNTTLGLKNARFQLNSQQDEALTTGSCRLFSLLSLPKTQFYSKSDKITNGSTPGSFQ